MNCEVEIHVGQREDVLAVPNAALRTQRDVGSAAQVLGLSPADVQRDLASRSQDTRDGGGAPVGTGGRAAMGGSAAAGGPGRPVDASFGGRYIVFVKRPEGPEAVWIRTGLTDLDYSEVVDGLQAGDSVLILPSADLVQSQAESRERINRITGGGLPGVQQQAPPSGARAPGGR